MVILFWIPAFAGMTREGGMTKKSEMTKEI